MIDVSLPTPVVTIRPRHHSAEESSLHQFGGHLCRIYRPAFVDESSGELVISAEFEWLLSGPGSLLARLAAAMPAACEILGELLLIGFGNSVGLIETPGLGRWHIISGKWGSQHFDRMLRDLMDIASALPFAAVSATALPYDRSIATQHEVLYHAFIYLRHVLTNEHPGSPDDLVTSLAGILRAPNRRTEGFRQHTPTELARRIDDATLIRIAAGLEPMAKAGMAGATPLATKLGGWLPQRVEEQGVRNTYDTPENRFVKAFVRVCEGVIEGMRSRVLESSTPAVFRTSIPRDCDAMDRALAPISRHSFWLDIGAMVHLPAGSTVLQRQRWYKDVFRHFARLRMAARVPLDTGTLLDLLENRDIALLYELWCFFTVVRALASLLGPPTSADRPHASTFAVNVEWDFSVTWGDTARLYYNRSFSRSSPSRHSYSVPLRPDITLQLLSAASSSSLHLFDAKFRLDRLDSLMPFGVEGSEMQAEAAEERTGTFKRADLYKMHAYRDAIVGARSVWILYPGDIARFFAVSGHAFDVHAGSELPDLAGVGAIPMAPAQVGQEALMRVLATLLSQAQRA
jgi:predicted component of viral defense system (DUF524 family)